MPGDGADVGLGIELGHGEEADALVEAARHEGRDAVHVVEGHKAHEAVLLRLFCKKDTTLTERKINGRSLS